jgi:hypothetical protein
MRVGLVTVNNDTIYLTVQPNSSIIMRRPCKCIVCFVKLEKELKQ